MLCISHEISESGPESWSNGILNFFRAYRAPIAIAAGILDSHGNLGVEEQDEFLDPNIKSVNQAGEYQ